MSAEHEYPLQLFGSVVALDDWRRGMYDRDYFTSAPREDVVDVYSRRTGCKVGSHTLPAELRLRAPCSAPYCDEDPYCITMRLERHTAVLKALGLWLVFDPATKRRVPWTAEIQQRRDREWQAWLDKAGPCPEWMLTSEP